MEKTNPSSILYIGAALTENVAVIQVTARKEKERTQVSTTQWCAISWWILLHVDRFHDALLSQCASLELLGHPLTVVTSLSASVDLVSLFFLVFQERAFDLFLDLFVFLESHEELLSVCLPFPLFLWEFWNFLTRCSGSLLSSVCPRSAKYPTRGASRPCSWLIGSNSWTKITLVTEI